MSGQTEPKCTAYHGTVPPEATGCIRYVQRDGAEMISNPLCDWHQGEGCTALRVDERRGEIREVGAVPLDYRERMEGAERAGIVRRIAEEIKAHPSRNPQEVADDIVAAIVERSGTMLPVLVAVRLRRHPASVGEVADEIARYVLELEASGVARGLRSELIERLRGPVVSDPPARVIIFGGEDGAA